MNGDIPDLSSPLGLNNKYDDADNYFGLSSAAGLSTPATEAVGNNFFNRSAFPQSRIDRHTDTSQSKAHDTFNYGTINVPANLFGAAGSNLHLPEHDSANWSAALAPDNRKVNGTAGTLFDAFTHPKADHSAIGMDFNSPNKNNSAFGNEILLSKMNYTEGPPGFSQAKKSPWPPCSSQSSSSIKNGFPSVSPLSSDNILSNSSVEDPRPGSTASSGRMASSGFGSIGGNWGGNNLGSYGFMDFGTINGFNKSLGFIVDINDIFKNYLQKRTNDSNNKCLHNFEILTAILNIDIARIRDSDIDNEIVIFDRMLASLKSHYKAYLQQDAASQEHHRQLEYLLTRAAKIIENDFVDNSEKLQLKTNLFNTLNTGLCTTSLEAANEFFISFTRFYHRLFTLLPSELIPHLAVIHDLSKRPPLPDNKTPNDGEPEDSLLRSYKVFVEELEKHRKIKILKDLNNNKDVEPGANNQNHDVSNGPSDTSGPTESNSNNVGNNRLQQAGNSNAPGVATNNSNSSNGPFDTKSCESVELPVFYNIEQLKNDQSIYMLYYYPVDSKMLNFDGVIPQIFADKCNTNTNNNVFNPNAVHGSISSGDDYQPIGRQIVQSIIDNELSKHKPGNVVFEDIDDESVCNKKSFVKLLNRLHIHFPNLEKKQLAEIIIQSKYALVKKDKYHYGFSGMKMKDIVRSVAEFVQENAIYNTNNEQSKAPGSSSSRNGQVSWSKIASSTATPSANGPASSTINGQSARIDELDRCSSLSPSQCSDRSANNHHHAQSSPFCEQASINSNFNNRKAFNTSGQCNQMFHNMA